MPNLSPGPHISPGPWIAAGPFAVLDSERNTVVTCAGPSKAANQALVSVAPTMYEIICQMYAFANDIEDEESRMPAELMELSRQVFQTVQGGRINHDTDL